MTDFQRSTGLTLLLVAVTAFPIAAVAAPDPLAQAENAYSRIEFGDTQRFAKQGLTRGGYDRTQMVRLYFLLGVSSAAEGKDDDALEAFKRLLILDPNTKLDRGLSPKLQGPMMEARGASTKPLSCEATFDRTRGVLHATITDESTMARTLVVRARTSTDAAFVEARAASAASVDVPLPGTAGARRVEFSYQLVDERQNRLFEKGSDAAPEIAEAVAVAAVPGTSAAGSTRKLKTPVLVAGIVGEVLGVGGIIGGGAAYALGKNAADRWNNDSKCLVNGLPRATNCASDRSTAKNAGAGSIAGFAVGGALVVVSTILLIVGPRTSTGADADAGHASTRSFQCGGGPGLVGFACGGQF